MTLHKCELCKLDISEECVFAIYKRVIAGEEHTFCCKHHADEFERKK